MSVMMSAGAMALTRMPCLAHSAARVRVSWSTPPLLVAYAEPPMPGATLPLTDDMLTITP